MSIEGEMDKENVIYMNNEILFSLKKKGHFAICKNMDGSGGHCAN